ncbi:hypothetical protein [Flexithrix dorotheae]|uniref:hypothetical protein n=1 Tax=Flexithrix dorotheae TaxID=70993 RepID=UPI00035D1980|nr:hypothetical protein [Flexithrix dorotheae]
MKKIFLILSFIASAFLANGQNLVENNGFEEFLEESNGQSYMSNVKHWYNANQYENTALFGTPDHMYSAKREDGARRNFKYFQPYKGKATAGLITYMQRVRDYREYISIKLTESLKIGNTYEVSMYVTNGNHSAFGNIGTNGLGVLLTDVPVKQKAYEPIYEQPQYFFEDVFYSTDWQKVTFTIKADKSYRYLTIGNFLKDYNLKKRYYNFDVDPQSYFFIDEVSVIETDGKDPEPEEEPIVQTEEPPAEEESMLEGRDVNIQNRFEIRGTEVLIKVWDKREVDGDIISLQFNGEWILKEYSLKKGKKKIKIKYDPNGDNILVFFAHSLGKEPPNTAAISLQSGKHKRVMSIRSDLKYCGAIQLVK